MSLLRLGLTGLMIACFAAAAGAAEPTGAVRTKFNEDLNRLSQHTGFECKFDQHIIYAEGGTQSYTGDIDVRRPGRFRWHYLQPYEQLYVGDGRVIWHYEPDLMQAERLTSLDAVDPVVMKLLDGRVRPADVVLEQHWYDSALNVDRYQLHIGDSQRLWLGLHPDGTLAYVESRDPMDNINRITLNQCSFVAPPEKRFSFVPPAGVDVVDIGPNR